MMAEPSQNVEVAAEAEYEKSLAAMEAGAAMPEPVVSGEAPVPEIAAEGAEEPAEEPFLGEMTKAQVLEKLALLDRLAPLAERAEALRGFDPEAAQERIHRSLAGQILGPWGKRLKALEEAQAQGVEWDAESLEALKAYDSGLHEKLSKLLASAKVKTADPWALVEPKLDEHLRPQMAYQMAQVHDAQQEILLRQHVPDAATLVARPEYAEWIKGLGEDEKRALVYWDARDQEGNRLPGYRDAPTVIGILNRFREKVTADEKKKAEAEAAAKRQTRPRPGAAPVAPAPTSGAAAEREYEEALRKMAPW